jgi:hypothetical protein
MSGAAAKHFLIAWQVRPEGTMTIEAYRSRSLADAALFGLCARVPGARVWVDGEVVIGGDHFEGVPYEPLPGWRES